MGKTMTDKQVRAQWTRLNNARRAARRAVADFGPTPLSATQVEERRLLMAKADAAQDACDRFYAEHNSRAGGALRC